MFVAKSQPSGLGVMNKSRNYSLTSMVTNMFITSDEVFHKTGVSSYWLSTFSLSGEDFP